MNLTKWLRRFVIILTIFNVLLGFAVSWAYLYLNCNPFVIGIEILINLIILTYILKVR